jgi:MFS family permease
MKSSTRAFGLIFLTLLIDVAAMGMSIPVLPSIISGFVGGDLARAAQLAGLVAALAAGLEFVFAPIMGALSDRYGCFYQIWWIIPFPHWKAENGVFTVCDHFDEQMYTFRPSNTFGLFVSLLTKCRDMAF